MFQAVYTDTTIFMFFLDAKHSLTSASQMYSQTSNRSWGFMRHIIQIFCLFFRLLWPPAIENLCQSNAHWNCTA